MDKKQIRNYVIVIGIILVAVFAMIKIRDYMNNGITGRVIENTQQNTVNTGASNIKRSAPTPTTCTPTQNCGSPSCGVASGSGSSCGCT